MSKNMVTLGYSDNDFVKFISIFTEIFSDDTACKQIEEFWCANADSTFDVHFKQEVKDYVDAVKRFLREILVKKTVLPHAIDTVCPNASVGGLQETFSASPSAQLFVSEEKVRIYADGVFDLVHSGHFNAFRQARALGDTLVVGINSDVEVRNAKGVKTIYSQEERAEIVRACKWVDEVIVGTPYEVSVAFLDKVNCQYAAHGDDLAVSANGKDCYTEPRQQDRLKIFRRTRGISSTALVRRLLYATEGLVSPIRNAATSTMAGSGDAVPTLHMDSTMLTSSKRLRQFIGIPKPVGPTDKRIYVDGSFDIFHVGHVRILQKAKELGDYLIVGIYDDATVRSIKGPGFPVVNMLERALNVLAMRVVDEVVMGAPWVITESLINFYNFDVVVRGSRVDGVTDSVYSEALEDPYEIPKKMNLYHEIPSSSTITTYQIMQRLIENRSLLSSTLHKRVRKENMYYIEKQKECLSLPLET